MIIYIRHGETDFNRQNRWMGSTDTPLNQEGINQSILAAQNLSIFNFEQIYTSPLNRAYSTAIEISKLQKSTHTITIMDELSERNFGQLEGKLKNNTLLQKANDLNGVESIESLTQRIYKAMSKINFLKNTLIVSHSAVFRCIINELGYSTHPKLEKLNNCQHVEIFK